MESGRPEPAGVPFSGVGVSPGRQGGLGGRGFRLGGEGAGVAPSFGGCVGASDKARNNICKGIWLPALPPSLGIACYIGELPPVEVYWYTPISRLLPKPLVVGLDQLGIPG